MHVTKRMRKIISYAKIIKRNHVGVLILNQVLLDFHLTQETIRAFGPQFIPILTMLCGFGWWWSCWSHISNGKGCVDNQVIHISFWIGSSNVYVWMSFRIAPRMNMPLDWGRGEEIVPLLSFFLFFWVLTCFDYHLKSIEQVTCF